MASDRRLGNVGGYLEGRFCRVESAVQACMFLNPSRAILAMTG